MWGFRSLKIYATKTHSPASLLNAAFLVVVLFDLSTEEQNYLLSHDSGHSKRGSKRGVSVFSEVDCIHDCCEVPLRMNRSCWYRNLYFRDNEFFYIPHPDEPLYSTITKESLTTFMSDRVQRTPPWHPVIVSSYYSEAPPWNIENTTEFLEWNSSVENVQGIYVICTLTCLWSNWGHSLFDALLSSFSALMKFGLHRGNFSLIVNNLDAPYVTNAVEDIFGQPMWDISRSVPGRWYRIENVVTGRGHMGFSSFDKNLVSMAKKENAIFHLRNRMVDRYVDMAAVFLYESDSRYKFLQVPLPSTPTDFLPHSRCTSNLFIIFVRTKRIIHNTDAEIELWIRWAVPTSIPVHVEIVRWEQFNNNLGDQIRFLHNVDIMITGPGTAICNAVFLKPGSVLINLGYIIADGNTGYIEEWLAPAINWVRVLYYPRLTPLEYNLETLERRLNQTKFLSIVADAARLICEGFSFPVPERLNLSPVGHATLYAFSLMPELHLFINMLHKMVPAEKLCSGSIESMLFNEPSTGWGNHCPQSLGGNRSRYLEVLAFTSSKFPAVFRSNVALSLSN